MLAHVVCVVESAIKRFEPSNAFIHLTNNYVNHFPRAMRLQESYQVCGAHIRCVGKASGQSFVRVNKRYVLFYAIRSTMSNILTVTVA